MLKQLKKAIDHGLKGLNSDSARELQGGGTHHLGWLNVEPVMVCPHDTKLQIFAIGRSKVAVGQGRLQKRPIFVPVPVEYECIDTAGRGSGNLFLENSGVRFVSISPKRYPWLAMPREAGRGGLDQIPFRPGRPMSLDVAFVLMIIAEVICSDLTCAVGAARLLRFQPPAEFNVRCQGASPDHKASSVHYSALGKFEYYQFALPQTREKLSAHFLAGLTQGQDSPFSELRDSIPRSSGRLRSRPELGAAA